MAITYPLTPPSSPEAQDIILAPQSSVAVSVSPFTFQRQVQENQGQRWILTVELPPMHREDAERWVAFLLSLNGRAGTFLYSPPASRTPRGNPLGTPLVNGADQTGQDLVTDGWTASTSGLLLPGDLIQVEDGGGDARLYKVLEQVDSDGGGNATITLWPNIRSATPDGASIVTTDPRGLFALQAFAEWSVDRARIYGITFAAEEAL